MLLMVLVLRGPWLLWHQFWASYLGFSFWKPVGPSFTSMFWELTVLGLGEGLPFQAGSSCSSAPEKFLIYSFVISWPLFSLFSLSGTPTSHMLCFSEGPLTSLSFPSFVTSLYLSVPVSRRSLLCYHSTLLIEFLISALWILNFKDSFLFAECSL